MKNNKKIIIPLLIVFSLLGIVAMGYFLYGLIDSSNTLSISGYYDADGNKIGSKESIVGGVEGVKYITMSVKVKNNDDVSLILKILSATPDGFNSALPLNIEQEVESGDSYTWESDLIDVEPYEGTTREFCVTINGNSPLREEVQKISCISIKVDPDATQAQDASFEVTVTSESNNDANIPEDNPPIETIGNVIFRTTDLSYSSDSAIAFAQSCGNTLTAYGYENDADDNANQCDTSSYLGSKIMPNIPGKLNPNGDGIVDLYEDASDSNEIWVCEDDSDGTGCVRARYDSTDSDATKVDVTSNSFDSPKEIFC